MATEEMAAEYVKERRAELEDILKFNLAVDDIWLAEGLSLDEKDVQAEVDIRVQQYKVRQALLPLLLMLGLLLMLPLPLLHAAVPFWKLQLKWRIELHYYMYVYRAKDSILVLT